MPNLFIKRGSGVIKVIIINNSNGSGVPPPGGAVGSEGWGPHSYRRPGPLNGIVLLLS